MAPSETSSEESPPQEEGAPENEATEADTSRRKRVVRSASWLAIGQAAAQILSLGSSVILTRLLTTEVYGIMELVYVFFTGLHLFSDFGITQLIVQSPRGAEPRFLNTIWTVQVIRGCVLFIAACIFGPVVAWADGEAQLALLIPAVGFTAVFDGLISTGFHSASRNLSLHYVVQIEIISKVTTVIIQVIVALMWPTAWALVAGAISGTMATAVFSFILIKSHPHRLEWDWDAISELVTFARWIFGSTIISFFTGQGDRLILNSMISKSELGVYGIAMRLRMAVVGFQSTLVRNLLLPVLAELNRDLSDLEEDDRMAALSDSYYRARFRIDSVFVTGAGVLMTFGGTLIEILYPPAYHLAGPILQVFSIQIAMFTTLGSSEAILTGLGYTKHYLLQGFGRLVVVLLVAPLGLYYFGFWGLVWAMALIEIIPSMVLLRQMSKLRLLRIGKEARAMVFLAAGAGIGVVLSALGQLVIAQIRGG